MSGKASQFSVPYAILAGLILLRFLPLVAGTAWFWGIGHLSQISAGYSFAFALAGLLALILPMFSKGESWGSAFADWISHVFYESRSRHASRAVVMLVAASVFTFFRMPTHFLGDGYTFLANIGSNAGHWIKWSEAGAIRLTMTVQSLLGTTSEASALEAFQILSVISGVITTYIYFLLAEVISTDPGKRLLTLSTLVFSSTILLYFGYVESYPILWAPATGFVYFGLKYSSEGKGAGLALLCLGLATFVHLQAAMFFPAMGFLVLSRGAGLNLFKRFRLLFVSLIVLFVVAVLVFFYKRYTTDLAFENIFLYLFSGKPAYPEYAVFSSKHLSDLLNLFMLAYPLGPLILALAWRGRRGRWHESTSVFLGLLSIGSLLFLLLIDPGLSMPRDWDLFAICWLSPTLLLVHLIPEPQFRTLRRLGIAIPAAALVLLLPFLLVNLSENLSLAEIQQIVANNPEKSFGTMTLLGTYYQKRGDQRHAEENLRRQRQNYPDFYRIKEAFQMMAEGRRDEAYRLFLQAKPDKFSKDYHSFLAGYYLQTGRAGDALEHAKAAVQLQVYFDRSYSLLAYAYYMNGEVDEGIRALRQGYSLNQRNKEFLTGLAQVNYNQKHFDSTLYYAERLREVDSTDPIYYYLRAKGNFGLANLRSAREDAFQYAQRGQSGSGFAQNHHELERLLSLAK